MIAKLNNKLKCPACGRKTGIWRRGICERCYADPEERAKWPARVRPEIITDLAVVDGINVAGDELTGPTAHLPGTPGKVAVLSARRAAGVPLHHPQDARATGGEDLCDSAAMFLAGWRTTFGDGVAEG